VGESLGREEVEAGMPFVGRSGQKLRAHAQAAGISLEKVRIENVYPLFPLGGSVTHVPAEELTRWQEDCRVRVRALPNVELIVCVGNLSLETFTGLRDITRRRGSVYEWEGRRVMGMIHPAAILHSGGRFEKHCRLDWERAFLMTKPHTTHHQYCGCALRRPRRYLTPYTVTERQMGTVVERVLKCAHDPAAVLSIDVETPKLGGVRQLYCVGFALDPETSLVLPYEEGNCWQTAIRELCESPCIKLGHNLISFDRWWLAQKGTHLQGEIRDTLAIHHVLDPASAHSLEFLVSRYLWEPWYKDEGQGHDQAKITDWASYQAYCGLDAMCTRELHDILWPQLEARGLEPLYRKHAEALFDPILDLMTKGVPIDHAQRQALLTESLRVGREARDRLGSVAGKPLFTLATRRDKAVFASLDSENPSLSLGVLEETYGKEAVQKSLDTITAKTVSNTQLKDLLYGQLVIPEQRKRRANGEYTATADALTLKQLRREYGDGRPEVKEIIDLALRHNKAQKLASFCYENHFSADGRFRFSLHINTEAARLSSSAAPDGRGQNSQNAPRDKRYRSMFLPEPGHVLLAFDLSNVEGRFCHLFTQDSEMIRLARLRSTEWDGHKFTAVVVGLAKDVESVTRPGRQISKSITHGAQRSMQGVRLSETLMREALDEEGNWNEAFIRTPEECDELLEKWHRAFPPVRQWHRRVRRTVRDTRRLLNPWGRIWDVRYEDMNDDLYRRAYSWLLQSSCADLMNTQGFIPLWRWLRTEGMQSRIMLHEHDELVCSCPLSEVYDVAQFARDHLEAPITYQGEALSIPVEFKVGSSWGETKEWSELPSRSDLEVYARSLVSA
jgi:uracil-DNA glycosylase family 4